MEWSVVKISGARVVFAQIPNVSVLFSGMVDKSGTASFKYVLSQIE